MRFRITHKQFEDRDGERICWYSRSEIERGEWVDALQWAMYESVRICATLHGIERIDGQEES